MDIAFSDLAFSTMAARAETAPSRWRKPFLDWLDGIESGWAIPLLLLGFFAIWFAYFIIAYIGGDLHSDVLEAWTFGRNLDWGYSKHPPLMGWAARAWTTLFPLTNWSFYLLEMINSAVALWAVDLITRRFARGDKRVVVLLLLMLLPVYQFHAQRFNANTVLLATWPFATYCFLRSFETRQLRWAAAAGAAAALAMLGKYYSVFLVVSFVAAALCHPQRRAYFTSWAPWVSIVVMFIALTPHLQWLATNGAKPLVYAVARHTGKAFIPSLLEAVLFLLGIALVLAVAAVPWAMIAGERLRQLSEDFRKLNPSLLLLFYIGVGTILFPALTSVMVGTDMPPIWSLHGLFLFVILIVCGSNFSIERFYSVNLAVAVIGIAALAAAVVAPVHALYRNTHPLHEGRNFYQAAAAELTRRWHDRTDAAIAAVGGDEGLAFALAFYSPDHPVYDERLVLPPVESLPLHPAGFRQGWVALCYDGDDGCMAAIERAAAGTARAVRSEFVIQSTLLGQPGASQGFAALFVPPFDDEKIAPRPDQGPVAQGSSEHPAVLARQDQPPCCAPSTYSIGTESESDERRPEYSPPPALPIKPDATKRTRRVNPADQALWPQRALSSALRDDFARWPLPSPKCTKRGNTSECPLAPRATASAATPAAAKPGYWMCRGGAGASDRPARLQTAESTAQPLSVRLKRQFCALADDLDHRLQLWRQDSKMDTRRRPI
jgi:4-amino-4-deoxy-L-arabinose transferase-like glycosyltransferase